MATPYTDDEVTAAVSRYVRAELRIDQSPLGPTDAQSKFGEVLALISSTLIFDPSAIFYLIYLASNKLNTSLLETLSYLGDLLEAIKEMGKRTVDVTNTSLLGDAAASLLTVDQILTGQKALSSPAYARYRTSVTSFIDKSLASNIREAGVLVRTPQQARSDSVTDLQSLVTTYPTLLADVAQLMSMLDEFVGLNLPVLAVQDSVRRVRSDLQGLQLSLNASPTKETRVALCRSAYLTLVAGKSVLDNYTTLSDPSGPRLVSSSSIVAEAVVPVGTAGSIVPASLTGTKSSPWTMVSGVTDQLVIAEDGNPPTVYTLTAPTQPSIQCGIPEPYNIMPGFNDRLELDGLSTPLILTPGEIQSATDVATDINGWVTLNAPGQYNATVVNVGGLDYVKITKTLSGVQRLVLTALASPTVINATYALLGFYTGQSDSNAGISGSEVVDEINAVGKVSASLVRTFFEEGTNGIVADTHNFDLPINTLDLEVTHVNDQLIIRMGQNAGYYRIASITRGATDRITVATDTPFPTTSSSQSWQLYRELLQISSKSHSTDSSLVVGTASANSLFGFSTGTFRGLTTGFRASRAGVVVDFSRAGVVVRDIVHVTTGAGESVHIVAELSDSGKQLEITPSLQMGAAISEFRILSSSAVAYGDFSQRVASWRSSLKTTDFATSLLELQRRLNPLLANTNPSLSQINDAWAEAKALQIVLTGLSDILVDFVVAPVGRVDAGLRMLKERGMDRAYDLLMRGQIANFFGMDKDDAATSSFMLKSMRSVVQNDLPVSKLEDNVGDTSLRYSVKETDANLDFSDQDTDENLRILGSTPDFDNPDDQTATQRLRY